MSYKQKLTFKKNPISGKNSFKISVAYCTMGTLRCLIEGGGGEVGINGGGGGGWKKKKNKKNGGL